MADEKKAGNPLWKPGVSGNRSGKSKTKMLTDQLRAILTQEPHRVRNIADKLVTLAEEGELEATKIILERMEGKVAQTLDVNTTVTNLTPDERRQRVIELQARLVGEDVEDVTEVPRLSNGH